MFAERFLREQAIDQLVVSMGAAIIHESIHFLNGRRQPSQIEAHSPDQRVTIGGWRGPEFFPLEPRHDEIIDGVIRPACIGKVRQRRANWLNISPMSRIRGALSNPLAERLNLD